MNGFAADYRHRRDHAEDRPPHTVIAARELAARNWPPAVSLDRISKTCCSPPR
jgi:hypothetical protein